MATKKEIHGNVSAAVAELCKANNVNGEIASGLQAILDTHLAPKTGGAQIDVDSVTTKDKSGNITEMVCSVSGVSLPATVEYFYEDKNGSGFADTGLKRLSRQGEGVRKSHNKSISATEKAIMSDVMEGVITPEDGKVKLAKAKATKPDYSGVKA